MKLGSLDISKVYLGSTEVSKAYLGDVLVHGSSAPPISYVDWLKSLGCVTWLPLTENDTEDKITETSLTMSGYGSMTWDAAKGMYKFSAPGTSSRYVAKLSNGLSASQFTNDVYSVLGVFEKVTSSNSTYYKEHPSLVSSNSDTLGAMSVATYNGTTKTSTIPSGTHKYARTIKSDERIFYYDGAVQGTYTGYANWLPSNWVVTDSGILLGLRGNSVSYYMGDVYIFNTYLPLSTIRQIQGFDPLPPNVIK